MSTKNLIVLVGGEKEKNLIERFAKKYGSNLNDWTKIIYPEAGNHPSTVMEMTDDYIVRALHGGKIIVETYSDNIIDRINRRVAEDGLYSESKGISDLVQIYYIHSDAEKCAQFDEIKIDSDYGIVDWPKGFCDYDIDENQAIIRAVAKKKWQKRDEELEIKNRNN